MLFVSSSNFTLNVKGSGSVILAGEIDTLNLVSSGKIRINADLRTHKLSANISEKSLVTVNGHLFRSYIELKDKAIFDNYSASTGLTSISAYNNTIARIYAEDNISLKANDNSIIRYMGTDNVSILYKEKTANVKSVENNGTTKITTINRLRGGNFTKFLY